MVLINTSQLVQASDSLQSDTIAYMLTKVYDSVVNPSVHFSNYSNFIVLIIGLCFVYAYILRQDDDESEEGEEDEVNDKFFLKVIKDFAKFGFGRIYKMRTKGLASATKLKTSIEVRLINDSLKIEDRSVLTRIIDQIKDVEEGVARATEKSKRRITMYTRAHHLSHASVFTGLYGIILLFLSSYNHNESCLLKFAVISDVIIIISMLVCIIGEFELLKIESKNKYFSFLFAIPLFFISKLFNRAFHPRKGWVFACLFIIIVLFFVLRSNIIDIPTLVGGFIFNNKKILIMLSVILVASNFIFYFSFSLLFTLIEISKFPKAIKKLKIQEAISTLNNMAEKSGLNQNNIDNYYNEKKISLNEFIAEKE